MIRAQNPNTEEWFDLPENTVAGEIVTDPITGEMFEVVEIKNDGKGQVATLNPVNIEEDWGE